MAKFEGIIQLLETRVARGDYTMTPFPTEHGLAEELSISRTTARKAIVHLIDVGLLDRDSSGRPSVTSDHTEQRPLHIGFVTFSLSAAALRWQSLIELLVNQAGGFMRVITFVHWDDPTLLEAVESFDGVFLIPPVDELSPRMAERLLQARARIVVLGANFSSSGLHGIENVAEGSVDALLDHLKELGHRRITALNTVPVVLAIEERLAQWQAWLSRHGLQGELINEATLPREDSRQKAYEIACERLASGDGMGGSAVLCTTLPVALGVMRAVNESGMIMGRDISVCAVNDEGMAQFLNPTLTSSRLGDPGSAVREAIEWMTGSEWDGPLLKCSEEVEIFVGGSTGAPVASLQTV
ncbi:GntR family transcriptional regulator [bacterium]|nr:MAG: GntR family transcriptional regulator [bacterium]